MKPKVPKLRGLRGQPKTPQLKRQRRGRRRREAGERRPAVLDLEKGEFDIGEGPWYYRGKKASSAEYRCLMVLDELGWTPDFQVSKFGGRTYPGGQVLDILITQRQPVVYIDVRGYWHRGAQGEANDARKIFQLRASAPDVTVIVIWDDEAKNKDMLYQKLLREVGARGGARRG